MTIGDLEAEAGVLYRTAGLDGDEPVRMVRLARALGVDVFVVHARALPEDAALATVHDERQIYVRRGLPIERAGFAVAHELGHWALGVDSSTRENEELCDAFAACLIAPRRAFQLALRADGDSFVSLVERFRTTESLVALRLGEVTDEPLALVTPASVRVRGAEFCWPEEDVIRALTKKSRAPGLRKARLSDDRRRVALRSCG